MFDAAQLRAIGEYARGLLAAGGVSRVVADDLAWRWEPYHRLLGPGGSAQRSLQPITDDVGGFTSGTTLPPQPLTLDQAALFPTATSVEAPAVDWAAASDTVAALATLYADVNDQDAPLAFEPLYFTIQRYASNLAASLAPPTLSLFRQFALTTALYAASGGATEPATRFTLVGSDTPGIQRFIGAGTSSKGIAKGLRGRSAFLQLVTDAVARRILDALQLPRSNLLYAAGGNLLLLAPEGADEQLQGIRRALSTALLSWSGGEIDQALAWVPVEADSIGRDVRPALRTLRQELAAIRRRPYADALADPTIYDRLFTAQRGDGDAEAVRDYNDLAEALARAAATEGLFLHRRRVVLAPNAREWQQALHGLSGGWMYTIGRSQRPRDAPVDWLTDAVNQPERAPDEATGFRFAGLTTPLDPDGSIRELETIAGATPMGRIGVLRMDIDGLGAIFGRDLQPATLATVCTLSAALDLFFAGWLNRLCTTVGRSRDLSGSASAARGDLLYTIYSGGDDLFVVGAWDRLPPLADAIRTDFARYCAGNPAFHISAGIAIEDARFPIYQLAERAAEALDAAKGSRPDKNALSLFGDVLPWEIFPAVRALVTRLTATTVEPSALLGRLRDLALLDREERARFGLAPASSGSNGPAPAMAMVGRAHWRGLVALRRAAEQYRGEDDALVDVLRELEQGLVAGTLTPHLALVARWADYLWRHGDARRGEE